jgi:hypothetical protein
MQSTSNRDDICILPIDATVACYISSPIRVFFFFPLFLLLHLRNKDVYISNAAEQQRGVSWHVMRPYGQKTANRPINSKKRQSLLN